MSDPDIRPSLRGLNATVHARGELPEPVVVPTRGEALGARFHARVALTYAIETEMTEPGAVPEELEIDFLEETRRAMSR